ncbi:MAG: (2Fe-2S)-binding protein, partial [Oscillospiraceae bacterium]|nr:(2Fe-2S)-binding protein [Oscillospiraceae bacterium]
GECNQGSCRACLVEATGARGLVASCVYPVSDGMEIRPFPKALNKSPNRRFFLEKYNVLLYI